MHYCVRGLSVWYENNHALQNVDFEVRNGETHALLGEHGSGKSTLCEVIAGFVQPASARIEIDGAPTRALNVRQAQARGIRLVNQENRLVESMSVASNLFLNNRSVISTPLVSRAKLYRHAAEYLDMWDLDIDPAERAANLHDADRLIVNILKHLYTRPSLLILDESFEKLTAAYLEKTKRFLSRLCEQGLALLVVTHRIEELFEFADYVTILRAGTVLFRDRVENTDTFDLIRLAYTQVSRTPKLENPGWEFYSLLKYNSAILERLPVNLIVVDHTLNLKIVNDSAREFLGLEGSETYNTHWEDLPVAANLGITSLLRNAIDNHAYDTALNVHAKLRERSYIVDVTVFPIFDGRRFLGLIVIMNDVTEKEQMRDRMILVEKLTSVGLLSAGVAHEINNPLEIISNYVDHIRLRTENIPEIESALSGIEEEVASISQITRNLLLFGDKTPAQSEPIECNGFLSDMLGLLRHSAELKGIRLHFSPIGYDLYIRANRNELKQLVLNIARNAFEAMSDGGNFFVHAEVPDRDPASPGTDTPSTPTLKITFRDTGAGLSVSNPGDPFLPFFTTKSASGENLGLGLSISYSIVQKNGGTLVGQNHPDGGAEFIVELPATTTSGSSYSFTEDVDSASTRPAHTAHSWNEDLES